MSGFPRFFLFYRVSGRFSAMGVQKHYKKRFAKKIVSKSFNKNSTKNTKPIFFSIFFYHVFGRSSMRGVQKHDKKNIEKMNLTLVLFRTLTHPPTTGVTDFFFSGPLPHQSRMSPVSSSSPPAPLPPFYRLSKKAHPKANKIQGAPKKKKATYPPIFFEIFCDFQV
jgi:hypothetical protein